MNDLRFAFRHLLKSPGFSAIAILTLALGIGLNTSMFSLMNLLLLQPLAYPDRDHLVRIFRTTPQSQNADHPAPDYLDLARFVGDDGEPDAKAVKAFVDGLPVKDDGKPRAPRPDANQGRSGSSGPKSTADSFAEFFRNNI